MEERQEVKTYRIRYKCPNCETGYLEPTARVLTSYPAQYPHKCNAGCGHTENFSKKYPHHTTEPCETVELTEDQRLQEFCDAINYNNLCARATLYPGLEIDEIPVLTIEDLKK